MKRDPALYPTPIQHAVLRVLSSVKQAISSEIHAALAEQWPGHSRRDISDVLGQLEVARLCRSNQDGLWQTTAAGQALGAGRSLHPPRDDQMPTDHQLLAWQTPCRPRVCMGTGDLRPPVQRPGSEIALALPSRMGGERRWPDGRREVV